MLQKKHSNVHEAINSCQILLLSPISRNTI